MQKVIKLGPSQVAITIDADARNAQLSKTLTPELRADGYTVCSVEQGYVGGEREVWLVMLKKPDPKPVSVEELPPNPEWEALMKKFGRPYNKEVLGER